MTTTQQQRSSLEKPQVTVLGAGYGGLLAALRLAPHARVTLVDPADRFTERVRLHERAAARTDISHPLAGLLRGTGVRHVAARAAALDPAARTVTTDDGQVLPYDRLVYALGSRTGTPAAAEAAVESQGRLHTAESAAALRDRMRGAPGSVAVVGGGLTGIEMAAELAETYPDRSIRLLSSGPVAAGHSARSRDHIRTVLSGLGVRIEEGIDVPGPEAVDADTVVWSASMVPNTGLASAAGLTLDPATGRIAVDETLRSVSHPEIYAAGDAAAAHNATAGALRMGCATALPTGSRAASSIISGIRGEQPAPLKFAYVVQCVSLGRRDGVVQFVRGDDSPRSRSLTGRTAARFKEQIVLSTIRTFRLARRTPGLIPAVPGMS
ncbi:MULTISPECIES: NAD(P)/FAD-dependent oxidoreductase [Streptomyces]|uniref:Pyridine nucleotide-disulfide oxidoreductase n=1 Tax=Streptomyces tsukubensis (strain DSM 42081 / NBRC 108919 / NRRL 18488 / 9993) TaxID=1114943 RepID=A0A7G3UGI7_STRT9|nr:MULTISPECIES: FAD-dependent oxidoreductase [Streptomyces]AZK95754.1 pyridine nucleotide-disulfide oxidoreductase [Streptomyces tsukubensis]MYS65680.1 FAD-dependent oxidoreductase [Streptomyces sp. SID5473]QKM68220.1 pyridine nucleotide-disulfide oxidoreductase [Streptomyces tsukubensis NRRL18488]TAI43038.1 pyridine nucleotide-disulfide oxidoreductase [Streptomyces tsukubensis]